MTAQSLEALARDFLCKLYGKGAHGSDEHRARLVSEIVAHEAPLTRLLETVRAGAVEECARVADFQASRGRMEHFTQSWIDCATTLAMEIRALSPSKVMGKAPAEAPTPGDGGWRDIASAPKDGTEIIVRGKYSDDAAIVLWDERHKEWRCRADGYDVIESQSDFGTDYRTFDVPSIWQPLPAPPQAAQEGDDNG